MPKLIFVFFWSFLVIWNCGPENGTGFALLAPEVFFVPEVQGAVMTKFRFFFGAYALAVFAVVLAPRAASAVTIDWVTVGDAGNAPNVFGNGQLAYGAVAYEYRIMKFEFTNSQYAEFLNSIDPAGGNPNNVFSTLQSAYANAGITFSSVAAAGSKYSVKPGMGQKPVTEVSWWDAARVANWLHNGANGTASTETGAYNLGGVNPALGGVVARNQDAKFYIPSEDEWYKAAFYKGGGTSSGYWTFPTQADSAPSNSIANGSNVANYFDGDYAVTQSPNSSAADTVLLVDANFLSQSASHYGTVEQSGNVKEWTHAYMAEYAVPRGGSFDSFVSYLNNSETWRPGVISGLSESWNTGFRLVSPVAVPEPSTWVMGLSGLACGGFSIWRRRKRS